MNTTSLPHTVPDGLRWAVGQGFSVFPLTDPNHGKSPKRGKVPLTVAGFTEGFKSATADLGQVEAVLAKYPGMNYGIATGAMSGIAVVDVDAHERVYQLDGVLPRTMIVCSGRDENPGFHLYYRIPSGVVVKGRKLVGDHVELKADGGYVVGPGSGHASGKAYWIMKGDDEIAELPRWLWERSVRSSVAKGSGFGSEASERDELPDVITDDRNGTVTKVLGAARHVGAPRSMLDTIARALFAEHVDPMAHGAEYTEVEALRSAKSVASYPVGKVPPSVRYGGSTLVTSGAGSLVALSTVVMTAIDYLWKPRVAIGMLTIVEGDPGIAKSTSTLDWAARVTVGAAWPDGASGDTEPGDVILLNGEDDLGSVIKPRLLAAGGNPDRVHYVDMRDDDGKPRPFSVPGDVNALEDLLTSVARPRLIIIDPIVAFLSDKTDTHNDKAIRKPLMALRDLAERAGVAIIVVRHLNKSGGTKAAYRGGGSIGFFGAVRSVMLFAEEPKDPEQPDQPDQPDRIVVAHSKCNYARKAESLVYRIEDLVVGPAETSRLVWEGTSALTGDELLGAETRGRPTEWPRERVGEWLWAQLLDGPVPASEGLDRAGKAGISETTLRRVMKDTGVRSEQRGDGWYWIGQVVK